jgi:hypothetical protein
MKTIKISAFEERWLRGALREDIDSYEEWEASPDGLSKKQIKELNLLRKFAEELPFRLTNAALRPPRAKK